MDCHRDYLARNSHTLLPPTVLCSRFADVGRCLYLFDAGHHWLSFSVENFSHFNIPSTNEITPGEMEMVVTHMIEHRESQTAIFHHTNGLNAPSLHYLANNIGDEICEN